MSEASEPVTTSTTTDDDTTAVTFKKRKLKRSKILSNDHQPSNEPSSTPSETTLTITELDRTSHELNKKHRTAGSSYLSSVVSLSEQNHESGNEQGGAPPTTKGIDFTVTSSYDPNADSSRKTYQVTASVSDQPLQKNTFNKAIPRGLLSQQQHQNVYARGTSTVDYALDICKDYKQFGWCAWGDSCKFLHHRGEHKSSTQLDREWNKAQEASVAASDDSSAKGSRDDDEDEKDKVPTVCGICQGPFLSQIVMTPCSHFFCLTCADKEIHADTACPVCGKPTKGRLLNARREIERRKELVAMTTANQEGI